MQVPAIIPARGGSKGLPRKNVRILCGQPLIVWTIRAAMQSQMVNRVVVSTDDKEIAAVSAHAGADVIMRPAEIAGDACPSESALLHALECLNHSAGYFAFLQCTAPLMLPADIDGTIQAAYGADTAFTATPWHRFIWRQNDAGAMPIGHSQAQRLMRQQISDRYLEVGAVYAMNTSGFLQARHRFFGRVAMHVIPPERSIEIDDETDFVVAETLMRRILLSNKAACLPSEIKAVVMDFDGVLTDNRVNVCESGEESITCQRGDGWALQKLKAAGIRLLVLTAETNSCVRQRCAKLGIDFLVAADDKLPTLRSWLETHRISPDHTIYVGNDEPDVPCLQYAACGVVPADAYPPARTVASIVLDTPGGYGCIRELAGMMLTNQEETYE